jgi:uncharacterized membrane protein HdeD (DUF308 family)
MGGVQLPAALTYGLGFILILFGALRAYTLGWQRREPEVTSDDPDAPPRRPSQAKRHIMFGVLWLIMGLFLVVSTFLNTRAQKAAARAHSGSGATLHLIR